jgi:hypothetical protein
MTKGTRDILGESMTTVRRGTQVPARWRLFVCGLALLASGRQEPPAAADPGADGAAKCAETDPDTACPAALKNTGSEGWEQGLESGFSRGRESAF